jgi:hypothetical protein
MREKMKDYKELFRHRRIYFVDPTDLMDYFGNWKNVDYIVLREIEDCEGSELIDVFYEPMRRCFGVVLARMDWQEIATGCEPPSFPGITHKSQIMKVKG